MNVGQSWARALSLHAPVSGHLAVGRTQPQSSACVPITHGARVPLLGSKASGDFAGCVARVL